MRPFRFRTAAPGAALACAVTLFGASAAPAAAQATDAAPAEDAAASDVAAATEALLAEYDEAYEDYLDARDEAIQAYLQERETNENARFTSPTVPDGAFFGRFAALAAQGSMTAQAWCVTHYTPGDDIEGQSADFTRRALDCLAHPTGDQSQIVSSIARRSGRRGVVDDDTGIALLHLAEIALDDADARAMAGFQRGTKLAADAATKAKGLAVLRGVAVRHADSEYGKRASNSVFELENLQIGMVAPEIVGADVDGNAMKLTDFRGKVVVLDFWGFW